MYPTDRKERQVIRKLQRDLSSMESLRERWNIKISDDKSQTTYFSCRNGPAESHRTSKGRNIPVANQVKYPDVIFDGKVTLRYHTTMRPSELLSLSAPNSTTRDWTLTLNYPPHGIHHICKDLRLINEYIGPCEREWK